MAAWQKVGVQNLDVPHNRDQVGEITEGVNGWSWWLRSKWGILIVILVILIILIIIVW